MKQILTKEMVKKAMEDLKASGKKTTNAMLYAALDHRGSSSTLQKLKAELAAEAAAAETPKDSEEGLQAFRQIWALARDESRKQQELVIADLNKDLNDMAQENERLDSEATAAIDRAADAIKAKAEIEAELSRVKTQLAQTQESLIKAGTDTHAALQRLAAEQAAHQTTQQTMQAELAKTKDKAHDFELDLVRCKGQLEVLSGQLKKQDSSPADRSATSSSGTVQSTKN